MAYRHGKKNRDRRLLYGALAVMVLSLVLVIAFSHRSRSPLPKAIDKQVDFVAFLPDSSWQVKTSGITYDSATKVLTIKASRDSTTLLVNEQAAPSQFNDIPQYYPTLLNKLNQYDSFGTVNGTVNLVRPSELKAVPQAVLYSNGTLLFVRPSKAVTATTWRQFFNNLQLQK